MKKFLAAAILSISAALSAGSQEKMFHLDFEDVNVKTPAVGNVAIRRYGDVKSVPGPVGNAALFDGNKAAVRTVKANWKFDKDTSFTIEFYIKPERNPSEGWSYPVMLNGLKFAGRPHINSPFLFITTAKGRAATIGTGTDDFNNGKWHHVAMSRNAQKRTIYYFCNGKLIKSIKETEDMTQAFAAASEIYIGAAGWTSYYKGAIDEFVISKGAKEKFDLSLLKKKNTVAQPPVEISREVAESWKVLDENKINLIPAPKSIKITGKAFDFKASKWSIDRKEKSDAPGYDHFIKRLAQCNIKDTFGSNTAKRIVAGLYKDTAKELSFKADKQPRQGYVIEVTPDKIVIAGTDEDGLRYGWLTLAALLNESGKMQVCQITDFPDFAVRAGHYSPNLFSLNDMKKVIDEVFTLRLNHLTTTRILSLLDPMPPQVREINDYAFARGIKCGFTGVPSVEDIVDYKKKIPRGQDSHSYSYRTNEGMFGWKGHAISWSRDDLAEAQAKRVAEYMKKHSFHFCILHPVDAGGLDNPSRWNSRSPKCRAKWGNDFFAAQEHLIKIYCDTIKKHNPEGAVHYVAYPYMPALLLKGDFAAHTSRINKLLGSDVKLIVREGLVKDMKKLHKITPDLFTVIYPFQHDYLTMHCNGARYMTTFYQNGLDSYGAYEIWSAAGIFGNASRLTFTEYLWNHNAPGAANMPEGLYTSFELITERSPEIEDTLLRRACAAIYGEKAAGVMTRLFAAKLSERHAEHPFKVLPASVDQEKYFAQQVKLTDDLIRDMRKIKSAVTPSAAAAWSQKFTFLKKVNLGSKARLHCIRANKLADAGKTAEAQAEAEKGAALISSRFARSCRATATLKNELDIAEKIKTGAIKKVYAAQGKHRNIKVGFYQYTGTGNGGSTAALPLLNSYDKVGGMRTVSVIDPTVSALKDIDVMIFAATTYVGDTSEDWRTNIRNMVVKDGKGVIFCHNAVGREKLTNLGKQIVPEICAGFDGRGANRRTLMVTDDSIFKGFLKKGDKYTEGYSDHMQVTPGKDGKVLLRDNTGKAVAVIGKVGRGFVVYTGEIFGISTKDTLIEPALDNWKMLYHLIRYASGE